MAGKIRKTLKSEIRAVMVALALAGGAREARGTLSNSIVKDNIEYYMQTDKAIYNLGENVEMLYRVTNLTYTDITFSFTHGPEYRQCDFIVEKDGETIWGTTDWPVTWGMTSFILNPSESREYTQLWNMTYNNGDPIIPENYDVTGVLSYYPDHERYVPVSVQIEIIPEPASLCLFMFSLPLLHYFNRGRRG